MAPELDTRLRNVPTQTRSRERLRRVLDAADQVLARDGAGAFTTTRIARVAGVPVGSVYRYFPDKEAIVEALATRYWSEFADLVAAAAELDEHSPTPDPPVACSRRWRRRSAGGPGFSPSGTGACAPSASATPPVRPARPSPPRWSGSSPCTGRGRPRAIAPRPLAWWWWPAMGSCARPSGPRAAATDQLLAESRVMLGAYVRARLGDEQA